MTTPITSTLYNPDNLRIVDFFFIYEYAFQSHTKQAGKNEIQSDKGRSRKEYRH